MHSNGCHVLAKELLVPLTFDRMLDFLWSFYGDGATDLTPIDVDCDVGSKSCKIGRPPGSVSEHFLESLPRLWIVLLGRCNVFFLGIGSHTLSPRGDVIFII